MEFLSRSLTDTKKFAADFLNKIAKAPPAPAVGAGGATVAGLYGNLGSGKTTFVQCLAAVLGVKEHITSPTFVIIKSYKLDAARHRTLIHIDAYRLKSGEELRKLGFEKLLRDSKNIIFIEWPEHVADILPQDHAKIKFEFVDEKTRKIDM